MRRWEKLYKSLRAWYPKFSGAMKSTLTFTVAINEAGNLWTKYLRAQLYALARERFRFVFHFGPCSFRVLNHYNIADNEGRVNTSPIPSACHIFQRRRYPVHLLI